MAEAHPQPAAAPPAPALSPQQRWAAHHRCGNHGAHGRRAWHVPGGGARDEITSCPAGEYKWKQLWKWRRQQQRACGHPSYGDTTGAAERGHELSHHPALFCVQLQQQDAAPSFTAGRLESRAASAKSSGVWTHGDSEQALPAHGAAQ